MDGVELNLEGMNELVADFERLINRYPDKADELLTKEMRQLRKNVTKRMKEEKKSRKKSKRPLENAGTYKISPVLGMGSRRYIEMGAKAPHFHLVERGHNLVLGGRTVKRVEGTKYFERTVNEHEEEMPQIVSKMVDELLKEGGF